MNPILVEATRGGIVESAHRGALVVVDAHGASVHALGDPTRPVFPRSAVKVLQALPLVTSGAADAFALGDEELALACASHNGQARHVATAAGMLAKAGLDEGALECGAHWPQHEVAQRELAASGALMGAPTLTAFAAPQGGAAGSGAAQRPLPATKNGALLTAARSRAAACARSGLSPTPLPTRANASASCVSGMPKVGIEQPSVPVGARERSAPVEACSAALISRITGCSART